MSDIERDILQELIDARIILEITIPQAKALKVLLASVIDEDAPKLDMLQFGCITYVHRYLNKSLDETCNKIKKGMRT